MLLFRMQLLMGYWLFMSLHLAIGHTGKKIELIRMKAVPWISVDMRVTASHHYLRILHIPHYSIRLRPSPPIHQHWYACS